MPARGASQQSNYTHKEKIMPEPKKSVRIVVNVSPETYRRMKIACSVQETGRSELVDVAVSDYLIRAFDREGNYVGEPPPPRMTREQEADCERELRTLIESERAEREGRVRS